MSYNGVYYTITDPNFSVFEVRSVIINNMIVSTFLQQVDFFRNVLAALIIEHLNALHSYNKAW